MTPTTRRSPVLNVAVLLVALFGLATLGGCPIFWGHDHDHDDHDHEHEHHEEEHRENGYRGER